MESHVHEVEPRKDLRLSPLAHPAVEVIIVAAVHEQDVGIPHRGEPPGPARRGLGSAVSSSTPTAFQPSLAIGVWRCSPAMNLRGSASSLERIPAAVEFDEGGGPLDRLAEELQQRRSDAGGVLLTARWKELHPASHVRRPCEVRRQPG